MTVVMTINEQNKSETDISRLFVPGLVRYTCSEMEFLPGDSEVCSAQRVAQGGLRSTRGSSSTHPCPCHR